MVSVLTRPQGVILSDTNIAATIDEDYGGYATVNKIAHLLIENQYVYIQCPVENYNGFWPIHVFDANRFTLKLPEGAYVPFIVATSIIYFTEEDTHTWSCVHLPIVYKLKTDRYPVSDPITAHVVQSITGYANQNGYVLLTLSGGLGTFEELAWVTIAGSANDEVNGVWQIIDKISNSSIVINLSYASYALVGATAQLYDANYNIVVRVYAGFQPGRFWQSIRPEELAATLRFIPDSNNEVKFSINEILKAYIETKNNTLLATLPNNTDFWTDFRIEFAESYDDSNGYTIVTFEGSFTADSLYGVAVNSMLPFKNRYSGFVSEYMDKFLTLFQSPVIFVGKYFDLSCIIRESTDTMVLKHEWYTGGVLQATTTKSIPNVGDGIYRIQPDQNCDYDRVDLSVLAANFSLLPAYPISDFTNEAGPGTNWASIGSTPQVSLSAGTSSDYLLSPSITGWVPSDNVVITLGVQIVLGGSVTISVEFYESGILVGTGTFTNTAGGDFIETFSAVVTGTPDEVKLKAINNGSGTRNILVRSLDVDVFDIITSAITAEIDCSCSNQDIYLSWLNNLGGFDHWKFTAQKDYITDIDDSGETSINIFGEWPKSYGEFSDTADRKQTFRSSSESILVRSQHLTLQQVQALSYIRKSVLVQIINGIYDRRTVIVDSESFTSYKEDEKLYTLSFMIKMTDNNPSQRL
jgi:hypothetical protein